MSTTEAQKRIADGPLATREIVRRLGTSASQLYRLLDQTNDRMSLGQLLAVPQVLNCDVDLVVRKSAAVKVAEDAFFRAMPAGVNSRGAADGSRAVILQDGDLQTDRAHVLTADLAGLTPCGQIRRDPEALGFALSALASARR